MSFEVAIKVEQVSKKYCKSLKKSMFYGVKDIGRNMLGMSSHSKNLRKDEFWALDDVSFEVKKGETLGIIGPNGSGKTTLLKLLNGIFWPDKGKITIKGKVGALIEIGAGFHPLLTGRENVYINGAILGMTKREVDERFDSMVEFADIGDFIDVPVKFYSSGMFVRLGFAIAVHCEPGILLVDEVLAVGDLSFRQKCFAKMAEIVGRGTTIVFVSHDITAVQKLCKNAIVLRQGKIHQSGLVQDVIGSYYDVNRSVSVLSEEAPKKKLSSFGVIYKEMNFYNCKGEKTRVFESGQDIIAEWSFDMEGRIKNPSVHFSMASDLHSYNGYSTHYDNVKIAHVDRDTTIRIRIRKPHLGPGEYIVSIGLWDEKFLGCYFWDYESTGKIQIISKRKMLSRFEFDHEWEIIQRNNEECTKPENMMKH